MKVLSIDFDIIMAPDINLYNPLTPRIAVIDDLINQHPCLTGLRADFTHYQKLANLILTVGANMNYHDVCVSFSHEHIGKFLINDTDLEIINIDHHHDLGYDENDNFEKCTCANWAYYLFKKGQLKKYTWLNNPNSGAIPPTQNEECFSSFPFCELEEKEYIKQFGQPDKIFLCLSPEWVPEQYHPLFFLMLDLLNKQNDYTLPVY